MPDSDKDPTSSCAAPCTFEGAATDQMLEVSRKFMHQMRSIFFYEICRKGLRELLIFDEIWSIFFIWKLLRVLSFVYFFLTIFSEENQKGYSTWTLSSKRIIYCFKKISKEYLCTNFVMATLIYLKLLNNYNQNYFKINQKYSYSEKFSTLIKNKSNTIRIINHN